MFNPLDHLIVFTPPLRLARSTWLSHIPFGMLLVDMLKPKLIVELGTYTGASYCTFCQIVKMGGNNTKCYAIDTWHGDPHQGYYEEEVFEDLRNYHDPLYSSFSDLLRCTFDDAINNFENQSIDLLHIDGCHSYDAAYHDFYQWLPKMSKRGVVILHDTQEKLNDFGVWKLWQEIESDYLSFEFTHGHGLGIIIVGEDPPKAITEFMTEAVANVEVVRLFFNTIGTKVELSYYSQVQQQQIDEKNTAINWLQDKVSEYDDLSSKWYIRGIRALNRYGILGTIMRMVKNKSQQS